MRARVLSSLLLLLVFLALPGAAQVCAPDQGPEISTLFPDEVDGMERQFYRSMAGAVTNMYPGSTPWAVVSMEPNQDVFLGGTADGLIRHYDRAGTDYIRFEGWPVARIQQGDLGEEYVTLRGAVRLTVLVKEAATPAESEATARTFLAAIFPRIPCEPGTY